MWLKRSEYKNMIERLCEKEGTVRLLENAVDKLKADKIRLTKQVDLLRTVTKTELNRIKELEDRLLAIQEENVKLAKLSTPPPVSFSTLEDAFEEEDEEGVAKLRKKMEEQGADTVLYESLMTEG